jgi:hypothetical protein
VSTPKLKNDAAPSPDVTAIAAALAEPFKPEQLGWKPAATTKDKSRAMAVPHIDARDVMNRLDKVVGITGWKDEYQVLPSGGVVCRLSVRFGRQWVTKSDAGGQSDQDDTGDRLKAAFSDALKRAAVKFGIGRYLYYVPKQWVPYNPVTRQLDLSRLPALPTWAKPSTNGAITHAQPK